LAEVRKIETFYQKYQMEKEITFTMEETSYENKINELADRIRPIEWLRSKFQ